MSSRAHLRRTSREWLDRLVDPDADPEQLSDLESTFFDEAEAAGAAFDSSEYWGLVNAALQGPTPKTSGPEGNAYDGPHAGNYPDGPVASWLEPREVKATHAALSRIDQAEMIRRLVAVGEEDNTPGREGSMWEDVWQEFEDLRAFLAAAAALGEWVLSLGE